MNPYLAVMLTHFAAGLVLGTFFPDCKLVILAMALVGFVGVVVLASTDDGRRRMHDG